MLHHAFDVKGRHDLTTQEWTKLGSHTESSISNFKTVLQTSFWAISRLYYRLLFGCYLHLCTKHNIVANIEVNVLSQC